MTSPLWPQVTTATWAGRARALALTVPALRRRARLPAKCGTAVWSGKSPEAWGPGHTHHSTVMGLGGAVEFKSSGLIFRLRNFIPLHVENSLAFESPLLLNKSPESLIGRHLGLGEPLKRTTRNETEDRRAASSRGKV